MDGFVGASPELLVSRVGDVVRAQPMAGTTPRTGEPEADQRRAAALLASHKNRVEHQITIDMVHDTLLPWCSFLDAEPEPSVVPAGPGAAPGQHRRGAAVPARGRRCSSWSRRCTRPPRSADGPGTAALAVIDELETGRPWPVRRSGRLDRRRGQRRMGGRHPIGAARPAPERVCSPVSASWRDSDPLAELEETRAKAQALLGSLVRL